VKNESDADETAMSVGALLSWKWSHFSRNFSYTYRRDCCGSLGKKNGSSAFSFSFCFCWIFPVLCGGALGGFRARHIVHSGMQKLILKISIF